jgi:hypothetical protein
LELFILFVTAIGKDLSEFYMLRRESEYFGYIMERVGGVFFIKID